MTLDFEIDIGMANDRGYSVIVRSPDGGESSAELHLPPAVDPLVIRAPDAVLASSAKVRRGATSDEQPVRELGRLLYQALFTSDVRGLLLATRQHADRDGGQLRIILRVNPPELAGLPWEFLFDSTDSEYLCLSVSLIRVPQVARLRRPLRVDGPLRVLGMIARPDDQPELAVEEEKRRLREALAPIEQAGGVELDWVAGQTWRALGSALRNGGPWHVLHFIGHGGFDSSAGEGTLFLAGDDGRSLPQPASNLALMLAAHDQLRLVVLNACETGRVGALHPFSSVATAIMGQRIPAVIGMQFAISDGAAVEFSRAFYEGIAHRLPLDAAVTHGRQAVLFSSPHTLEWGCPVLYLRSPDSSVFDLAEGFEPSNLPSGKGARELTHDSELENLYNKGLTAYYTERWDDAIEAFQAVLGHDRNYKDVGARLDQAVLHQQLAGRYAAGLAAANAGAWTDAIAYFEALIAAQPNYRDAQTRLADVRRQLDLTDLQAKARRFYEANDWSAVVAVGEQLTALDQNSADPGGLIASAQNKLEAQVRAEDLERRYSHALRHLDVGSWRRALGLLKSIQQIDPRYEETVKLIAYARRELALAGQISDEAAQLRTITMPKLVPGVEFSPSGCLIGVASGKTGCILDAITGRKKLTVRHEGLLVKVNYIDFSPDELRFATASSDQTARIWDIASGAEVRRFIHGGYLGGLGLSPDGRQLATASWIEGTPMAHLWDVVSGKEIWNCKFRNDWICDFDSNGRLLGAIVADKTISLLDFASGDILLAIPLEGGARRLMLCAKGRRFGVISEDGKVRIWDFSGNTLLTVTPGDSVRFGQFSRDGLLLAIVNSDRIVQVWDFSSNLEPLKITLGAYVNYVTFSPNGQLLATATNKTVQIWQLVEPVDE